MGIDSSTLSRTSQQGGSNVYSVAELGYRYAMSDLNAAIALAQLPHLDDGNARRAAIAARYTEAFSASTLIRTLAHSPDRHSSHHLYAILHERRDHLAAALRAHGIVTGTHYPRNDIYSLFNTAKLPEAERFASQVITLPIHLGLSDADVDRVIETVTGG
jgi:dTDP-4-amino-4,6-dideoxygalactose transaminase